MNILTCLNGPVVATYSLKAGNVETRNEQKRRGKRRKWAVFTQIISIGASAFGLSKSRVLHERTKTLTISTTCLIARSGYESTQLVLQQSTNNGLQPWCLEINVLPFLPAAAQATRPLSCGQNAAYRKACRQWPERQC